MGINIDTKSLQKTFVSLVKIPSPSGNERAVMDYIKDFCGKLGYMATEDKAGKKTGGNAGNVIVRVPGNAIGKTSMLLTAHVDTVEDGVSPVNPLFDISKNRFYTNGETILGGDDKIGVAILLEVLRLLKKHKTAHGELLFVFSVNEEKGSHGAEALDPDLYKNLDIGIVLDHSGAPELLVGAPTKVELHITVHGVGGHAAAPENHINAAQVLARTVGRLPMGRLDEYTTANLGVMWSGTAANIIPEFAYAEYEIRSHKEPLLDSHLAQILMLIENSVREARIANRDSRKTKEGLKATVDVDLITSFCGYRLDDNSLPVRILEKAMKQAGVKCGKVIANGGTDANTYNAKGLPSVAIGCGMHEIHGTNEYADLEEMTDCGNVVLRAIFGE